MPQISVSAPINRSDTGDHCKPVFGSVAGTPPAGAGLAVGVLGTAGAAGVLGAGAGALGAAAGALGAAAGGLGVVAGGLGAAAGALGAG